MTKEEEKKPEEQQEAANNVNNNDNTNVDNGQQTTDNSQLNDNDNLNDNLNNGVREPVQLGNWYEQLFRQDNASEAAEISDEQKRKMQRRERAERVIAGLGDIGTHIANIVYAGKGGVPAKPTTTLSENVNNEWQRYNVDIEKRRQAYRAGLNASRKLDYQRYLDDRKQQLSEEKEERMRWQQEHKYDLDKLREAKTKAEIARIEQRTPAEIAVLEQQAAYWEARAEESKARAAGKIPVRSGGGGGKQSQSTPRYTSPGGVPCRTQDEYHNVLLQEAEELGVSFRTRNGQPWVTDYGVLINEIEKAREKKGLPRNAARATSKPAQPKKDYSQYEVK